MVREGQWLWGLKWAESACAPGDACTFQSPLLGEQAGSLDSSSQGLKRTMVA